ncbi:Oxidoreductase, N-terminal [Candidatus Methylopumilus universalis]|uniref:Gfo/Idh/MocA family protein n=1 Tax=Candidatus Methylopumilus universalis TaxID=2588536 RepID=UPI003BEF16B6
MRPIIIKKNICKVAFVGAGYMTTEHLKAFCNLPDVELSGITSRTYSRAEKLAKEYKNLSVCDSIAELYEITKAHLVVISVPELATRDVCEEAFKYPWTCLIEKPIGYNLTEAEAIEIMAINQNCNVFIALNRRHHNSTKIILDDISKQKSPRLIHVYDQEDQTVALNMGQPDLVVKNWMYANSIHVIDYFNIFCRGNIIKIDPIVEWDATTPFLVMTKLTYDSGDIGIYEAVWNTPGPWAVTVTTQEKRWELRPLEQASFQSYGSRRLEVVPINVLDTEFKPGLRVQASEAVQAALDKPHSLPSLNDAMKLMRLIHTIYDER